MDRLYRRLRWRRLPRAPQYATDWRTDTRENTCGDPNCDGKRHHPPGQVREFPPSTREWRAAVLAKGIGAK